MSDMAQSTQAAFNIGQTLRGLIRRPAQEKYNEIMSDTSLDTETRYKMVQDLEKQYKFRREELEKFSPKKEEPNLVRTGDGYSMWNPHLGKYEDTGLKTPSSRESAGSFRPIKGEDGADYNYNNRTGEVTPLRTDEVGRKRKAELFGELGKAADNISPEFGNKFREDNKDFQDTVGNGTAAFNSIPDTTKGRDQMIATGEQAEQDAADAKAVLDQLMNSMPEGYNPEHEKAVVAAEKDYLAKKGLYESIKTDAAAARQFKKGTKATERMLSKSGSMLSQAKNLLASDDEVGEPPVGEDKSLKNKKSLKTTLGKLPKGVVNVDGDLQEDMSPKYKEALQWAKKNPNDPRAKRIFEIVGAK